MFEVPQFFHNNIDITKTHSTFTTFPVNNSNIPVPWGIATIAKKLIIQKQCV